MTSRCFYRPLGEGRFQPTEHIQGAWLEHEQHMAPVGGLIANQLETHERRDDLQLSKITYEILGQIRAEETTVAVEVARPGRTIELLTATATIGGRPVVRATAWRLAAGDTAAIAGHEFTALPPPTELPTVDMTRRWPGGYIRALEVRATEDSRPGRGRAWIRSDVQLLEEGGSTPTADFIRLVDTANGVAVRESPTEWMFPNTDLSIHLFRQPEPGWVGFDTSVAFGPTGVGLTSSTLHDINGPVGRCEQILTVRPMPER